MMLWSSNFTAMVMKISNYVNNNLICFIDASTKENALKLLIEASLKIKALPDGEKFFNAIYEREKIVSTGIGMGVAIPHAKLASYHDFFLVIGVLSRGLPWNALDGAPVRLIFLIGGPDDKQTEYLQILSLLTTALRDENLRKEMLAATSPEEITKLFEGI
ncbi:MAG: hypothetical protein JWO53_719 [Chlamydiia bacterium]|nr:hypothetical protein [Chlamydiia bacterium]